MQRIGLRKGKKRAIHTFGEVKKTGSGYEIGKLFTGGVLCRVTTERKLREGFSWIAVRPYLGEGDPLILSELTAAGNDIKGIFERGKEVFEIYLDNRGRAKNLKEGKKYLIEIIPRKRFFELYERMPLGKGKRAEPTEVREERILNFLEMGHIKKGERVLDAATGIKEYLRYFDKQGRLTCLNISSGVLESTKEWLASDSASFISYDAESGFPFKNESFDLIICDALLEYVSDPHRVLKNASRITKKGGSMLVLEPVKSGKIQDFYPQDLWEIALWRPRYAPIFNEKAVEETVRREGLKIVEKREMRFYYPIFDKVEFCQGILKVQKFL